MKRLLLVTLLAVAASGSTAWAVDPIAQRNYIRFTAGQPSGTQTVKEYPGGRSSIHFTYNDRGWGPDLTTEMTVDGHGRLTSFMATGSSRSKASVNERFEIHKGMAVWRSSPEQSEQQVSADGFYLPVNQPPEYRAVLARALLAQPDLKIALIPVGSARIEVAARKTFVVKKIPRTATLYAITGLELMPSYVWLDEEQALVGYNIGWSTVLRDNWAEQLAAINAEQEAALARHIHAEAGRLRQRIERPLAIVNARVLDIEAGRLTPPATVVIREGRIAAVGSDISLPSGIDRIDAGGKTLMAGLWDMHAHMKPSFYLNYIASGVLNVRDMGNDPQYMAVLRRDIAAGNVAAPDVYPMGFIDRRGPYAAPTGRVVATLDEARKAVHTYAEEGYVGIKLYSSIDPAWVPELTREARLLGLRTAGHIPAFLSAEGAIRGGYSEVTHINMILLQLIGDWTVDTRTPRRMTVPGERGGFIDMEAASTQAFLDLMVERGIALDPTVAVSMDRFNSRPGEILPSAVEFADWLPSSLRRDQIGSVSDNDGKEQLYQRSGEVTLSLVKRLHERGVRILPGTDAWLPGFMLVSELQYYARAGISNVDVLRLATTGAAKHLGLDGELGSIAPGKKAHLMLIDGDPIHDLSALRRVDRVIKGDAMFRPREILRAQGIEPP